MSEDKVDYLCDRRTVTEYLGRVDPRSYDKTRNYLDGSVSWLSPFVTHGVCSTRELAQAVLVDYKPKQCYRWLFELGWREFFHRTWQLHQEAIFEDMHQSQSGARYDQLPQAMVTASSGVDVIDQAIEKLYESGLMHNHARMWVAGITCNLAATHWLPAARWLHYHLLDGDLASNTLSWQWIAGTFSHKQYLANQGNLDKYSRSQQPGSWLDVSYEELENLQLPEHMRRRTDIDYTTELPGKPIEPLQGTVALRSVWNLDPKWQADIRQQLVFIDTELNAQWPMSMQRWRFINHWAEQCQAHIVYGTQADLIRCCEGASVIRQEYPVCHAWPGTVEERDWLYPMPEGPFRSFSQYFKQVKHHAGL